MRRSALVVVLSALLLSACGGLRYVQVSPEAKNFHPSRIGVLPADVGTYEEARGVIDQVIAGVLMEKKWFKDVVGGDTIANQLAANEELRQVVGEYQAKLKSVNYSDPELSARIGELARVDAFLIVNVDYWNYSLENEKKVAKVGLGMKLIDAATGKIIWKAGHHVAQDYILFKPKLPDVAKDVVKAMIAEMPH